MKNDDNNILFVECEINDNPDYSISLYGGTVCGVACTSGSVCGTGCTMTSGTHCGWGCN